MKMLGRFWSWHRSRSRRDVRTWRKTVEKRQVAAEIEEEKTCRHGISVTDPDAAACAFYEDPDHLAIAGPGQPGRRHKWVRPYSDGCCPVCGAWFCDLDCTEDPSDDGG